MTHKTSSEDWLRSGAPHIWHPYTQMQTAPLPLAVREASGCTLILENGQSLLDGISSWWTMCHGYNHPHIHQAIATQLATLPHVMFAGLAHQPAYRLAERLAKIVPTGLTRTFFSDSGSVAIEVAMKMAVHYWRNLGEKNKTKFISFHNGYHGDTMGCMSLSDPDSEQSMHRAYANYLPKQYIWNIPLDEFSFSEFDELLGEITRTTAGLVIEPLVQCAGGMIFHSADVLAEIHRLCKKHHILFIADEIATGFGRTGSMFACDEAGITPDIMCIGKALSGGLLPLAATMATDNIFSAFLSDQQDKAFMHGPTYMANPLACAAANASLDLFEQENMLSKIESIEKQLWDGLAPCRSMPHIHDVRVKGAIGVVQLTNNSPSIIANLRARFIEEGVWLRPFGNVIYIMPPFVITEKELEKILITVVKLCREI